MSHTAGVRTCMFCCDQEPDEIEDPTKGCAKGHFACYRKQKNYTRNPAWGSQGSGNFMGARINPYKTTYCRVVRGFKQPCGTFLCRLSRGPSCSKSFNPDARAVVMSVWFLCGCGWHPSLKAASRRECREFSKLQRSRIPSGKGAAAGHEKLPRLLFTFVSQPRQNCQFNLARPIVLGGPSL